MKSRIDYEKLMDTKIYTKACLRLKFPNESIVQVNFALMETVGDIYNYLKEYIVLDTNEEFYLFTSPPLKKFLDMKAKVFTESLHPYTLMHIGYPNLGNKQY
jgi:hypothetical protein